MIEKKLEEIEWHDCTIYSIHFDSILDSFDSIKMILTSEAFIKDYKSESISIQFKDVFKVKADMNMWLSGRDSINSALIKDDSEWVIEVMNMLSDGFGPKKLIHFVINSNTNSNFEFLLTSEKVMLEGITSVK